jgi:hypothetical protein
MKRLLYEFFYALSWPFSLLSSGDVPEGAQKVLSFRYLLVILAITAVLVFVVWFIGDVLHWF